MADISNNGVFSRLKKLFSTNTIVRNVGGKKLRIADTDQIQSFVNRRGVDRYHRVYNSATGGYGSSHGRYEAAASFQGARLQLFRDYDMMDCLHGDTRIPLPTGEHVTIRDLARKFDGTPFYVFSYDKETDTVKLGKATNVWLKGTRDTVKITFDNNETLIVTHDHPIMMRDGTYKSAKDIQNGESVMPFYQKDFYKKGYRSIYNFSKGWQSEHRLVSEQFDRPLSTNEVVHHKDFNKQNNHPDNLQIMGDSEHRAYHARINNEIIWSNENRPHQVEKIRLGIKNRKAHRWGGHRTGSNNPFYGKTHSVKSNIVRAQKMITWHKNNPLKVTNENNPNYRHDITLDTIKNIALQEYVTRGTFSIQSIADKLNCDTSILRNRVGDWKTFKCDTQQTLNHTVVSVVDYEPSEVFDMTVEHYHNFATENCFVHNCDPIIASVLDIYADESTVKDEFDRILTIKTDDTQIQEILHNLFYDILNVEFNLWPWVRNMAKYGDLFLYLDIDPEYGIVNAVPLSVYETIRVEGEQPGNPFSVRFSIDTDFLQLGKKDFDNYEIAHFRLLSDTNFLPYGKAMIEGGRRTWKQLQLMEDAMLIHRIMRAPDKRKFKIDIGNIPPAEVDTYMNRIIDRSKKTPLVDPKTGDYNLRYNMMNITEDFYLPVRGKDSGTEIETMQGLQFNAIEDIEYLRKKLLAAFKVPKSFIGYEEDINGKATLAAQDVRFARTIERIQRIMISELTKIAIIHLYVQGFTDEKLVNFELSLTNPSTLYEQEKINIWKEKFGLAQQMTGGQTILLSQDWVYNHILELSDDEIAEERKKIIEDVKRQQEQQAMAQPQDPQMGGMPPEGGAPPEGEVPPEGDANADGQEAQIDDVEQILQSLEDSSVDEEVDDELEEALMKNKGGRPREGLKFGTDKHPLGRDPLGHKENTKRYKRSALSLETKSFLGKMQLKNTSRYKQIIAENIASTDKIED